MIKQLTKIDIIAIAVTLVFIGIAVWGVMFLINEKSEKAISYAEASEDVKVENEYSVSRANGSKESKDTDNNISSEAEESIETEVSKPEENTQSESNTTSEVAESSTSDDNEQGGSGEESKSNDAPGENREASEAVEIPEPEVSRVTDNPGSSGGDPDNPFYQGGDNPFAGDVSNTYTYNSGEIDLSNGVAF
ncbi:MAG: hypothetical protein PHD46_04540 [Eubacteriales bacterium]|nr:hypothetical protein [Eubacteriales bacterium]MDD4422286.1 hypothetical protein [Eubacteriales bacterium]